MGDATALSGVTAYFARSLVAIVIFQLLLAAEILLSVAGYKKGEAQMAGSPESR
jgi:hypothetical protein